VSAEGPAPTASATAVYVAFRTRALDLGWIPAAAEVIVVHNDDALDERLCTHAGVRHVRTGDNVGFGAAVNAALPLVRTDRVVLCNPDTRLAPEHWDALMAGSPDEVRTIGLVDSLGRPTSTINRYPTPLSLLLTAYRVGRMAKRGSATRRRLERALGGWGAEHAALREVRSGDWTLADYWVSGAVVSLSTERLRAVGGFDTRFFLYMEDVDLCARLAATYGDMRISLAATEPAVHAVGGSARRRAERLTVDRHHLRSVRRYCDAQEGTAWRLARIATAPRSLWLSAPRSLART